MPSRPLSALRSKEVDDDCGNDNSNRKDNICDYVNIGCLEIDISFVLIVMSSDLLLGYMTAKKTVFHWKNLFGNFVAAAGYYLLTTFL